MVPIYWSIVFNEPSVFLGYSLSEQYPIMCQSYPKEHSSATSNTQGNPRLYPSLAQMLASMASGNQESPPSEGTQHMDPNPIGESDIRGFLNRLIQEFTTGNIDSQQWNNRHPYQEPQQSDAPYPEASNGFVPPFEGPSPRSPWNRPRASSGSSPGGWWHPNQDAQQSPNDPTTETCRAFAKSIKGSLRRMFLMIFLAAFVFLVPQTILVYGIFISGIFAMGWPLKPFLVTGMAIHALLWISPCFLEFLAVYALFKKFMLKKPLLNRGYWHSFFSIDAPTYRQ